MNHGYDFKKFLSNHNYLDVIITITGAGNTSQWPITRVGWIIYANWNLDENTHVELFDNRSVRHAVTFKEFNTLWKLGEIEVFVKA